MIRQILWLQKEKEEGGRRAGDKGGNFLLWLRASEAHNFQIEMKATNTIRNFLWNFILHKGHMTWSNSVKKGETGTLNTGETCMRLYPLTGFTAAPSVLTLAVPVIHRPIQHHPGQSVTDYHNWNAWWRLLGPKVPSQWQINEIIHSLSYMRDAL